jgi:hypothetical protein
MLINSSPGGAGGFYRRRHFMHRTTIEQCAFAVCLSIGLIGTLVATSLQAQQPPAPAPVEASTESDREGRQVTLFDQLRIGLKAKTKADIAFLELVVLRVNQGKLPRKMVDATFLWARNRYKARHANHRLRPIVYFQPALVAQAKKIGVVL